MNAYKRVGAADPPVIMIVNDKAHFRDALTHSLKEIGYRVCCAANRDDALTLCNQTAIDLTLVDSQLPDTNGYLLCTELATEYNLPVIIVFGTNRVEDMLQGFAAGARDFIKKPFPFQELSRKIQHALCKAC
jgi:two-component system, OmpR family, response regulator